MCAFSYQAFANGTQKTKMHLPEAASPDIPDFYRGKSVFITGATGFMGKVLVERLLRTCPDIKKIYLLIRQKKGLDPERRLHQLKQCEVFDMLRTNHPSRLEKLVAIPGDITRKNLDLTLDARELISEVSIVFHSAATVKMQEELRLSVDQNLRSVISLLQLCDTLPKVDVFVHVSTAYSNAELNQVDEKVYPPPTDLKTLMDVMDDEVLTREQCKKLTGLKPNTYTFTKAMAEHVVASHGCGKYPVAVFRPTIVISSLRYPFPGWIENLNGPSGVIAAVCTGFLRVFRCRGSCLADMIPVDIASDTLIAAARDTALDRPSEVRVYNCSTEENPTKWEDFQAALNTITPKYPSSKAFIYPHLMIVENRYVYRLLEILLQSIPLHLMEYCTRIIGVKTRINFVKLNRSLKAMNKALEFFTLREWNFSNENTRKLRQNLSKNDRAVFNLDPKTIVWSNLISDFIKGTRRHVMREKDTDLENVRTRLSTLNMVYTATRLLFTLASLRLINHWLSIRDFLDFSYRYLAARLSNAIYCPNLVIGF